MTIHKKTRLTPFQRRAIYHTPYKENLTVSGLARAYSVS